MPNAEVLSYDPTQDYLMHLARYQIRDVTQMITLPQSIDQPVVVRNFRTTSRRDSFSVSLSSAK